MIRSLLNLWHCSRDRHREEIIATDLSTVVCRRSGWRRQAGWQTLRCVCCGRTRRVPVLGLVEVPLRRVEDVYPVVAVGRGFVFAGVSAETLPSAC